MSTQPTTPPTYGNLPVQIDPTAWNGRTATYRLDIGEIQKQLAGQLNALFAQFGLSISTYVFPNFDLDTWWNGSDIAFILISYKGSDYSTPKSTNAMLQERTLKFIFHVEARQIAWPLTGKGSVYLLIEAVKNAMTGFKVNGCRNAYFTEERFSEQDPQGRVWLYDMEFHVVTMNQQLQPLQTLAALEELKFNLTASIGLNDSPTEQITVPAT